MKDIWAGDPTADYLKQEWGDDVFYASALHSLACEEERIQKKREAEAGSQTRPVKVVKKR